MPAAILEHGRNVHENDVTLVGPAQVPLQDLRLGAVPALAVREGCQLREHPKHTVLNLWQSTCKLSLWKTKHGRPHQAAARNPFDQRM